MSEGEAKRASYVMSSEQKRYVGDLRKVMREYASIYGETLRTICLTSPAVTLSDKKCLLTSGFPMNGKREFLLGNIEKTDQNLQLRGIELTEFLAHRVVGGKETSPQWENSERVTKIIQLLQEKATALKVGAMDLFVPYDKNGVKFNKTELIILALLYISFKEEGTGLQKKAEAPLFEIMLELSSENYCRSLTAFYYPERLNDAKEAHPLDFTERWAALITFIVSRTKKRIETNPLMDELNKKANRRIIDAHINVYLANIGKMKETAGISESYAICVSHGVKIGKPFVLWHQNDLITKIQTENANFIVSASIRPMGEIVSGQKQASQSAALLTAGSKTLPASTIASAMFNMANTNRKQPKNAANPDKPKEAEKAAVPKDGPVEAVDSKLAELMAGKRVVGPIDESDPRVNLEFIDKLMEDVTSRGILDKDIVCTACKELYAEDISARWWDDRGVRTDDSELATYGLMKVGNDKKVKDPKNDKGKMITARTYKFERMLPLS